MKHLLALLACLLPSVALAAPEVSLASEVLVERVRQGTHGKPAVVLEAPKLVTPGDRLHFVLAYKNEGQQPAADFVVTNPVPAAVAYTESDGEGAVLSVDGGKSWGELAALRVKESDGTLRPAGPQDVTHVRWKFTRAIPAGGAGKLSFRATVK